MSVHRIKVESTSIVATIVTPTWDGEVEYALERDAVFFRSKVGEFKFQGDDYTIIKEAPDCELIEIYLEEKCGVTWSEVWRGSFTTYDVSFNLNKCTAKVTPKTIDEYQCLFDNWETDYVVADVFSIPLVTVTPFAGNYEVGECCYVCFEIPPDPSLSNCTDPPDYCFSGTFESPETPVLYCPYGQFYFSSCYHRIVGTGTAIDPPPYNGGWTYLSGNDWWRCPDVGEIEAYPFTHGRMLNDVIEYLSDQICELTVRSHFFGINATHAAAPTNDAYAFADANFQAIQLHQKSDIKRPFDSDEAQSFVWKMNLKKLLEDLRVMMNVYWVVDGTDLIIEHSSYFDAAVGLDLTEQNIALEYGKTEGAAPNVEEFLWADASATFTTAHKGYPISYGECGEGKKKNQVNYFSNDVNYISTVKNQEEIADSGYCLIATEEVDGISIMIDGNNPLGWVALHENLHKDRRYFMEGNMNDTPATAFISTIKTRKLKEFTTKICCDEAFNLTDTIDTLAGEASVQKATFKYFAGTDAKHVTIEANI